MDVSEARIALVGAWRLLSYADRSAVEEPWDFTFGSDPRRLIVYHDSALMSVQVAAALGTMLLLALHRIPRDLRRARGGSTRGKIVGIVLHHMDVAYPPELLEEEPERDF